jgi:hypothetical protein
VEGSVTSRQAYEFQLRSWKIQRISWVLLYAVILAAFLGAFGKGGFFSVGGTGNSGLGLKYERFGRLGTSSRVWLRVPVMELDASGTEVALSRAFMERVDLEGITPEPDHWDSNATELLLSYPRGAVADRWIHVQYKPRSPGFLTATIRHGNAAPVSFTQFIFP